jgi:hypothetical protein
MFITHTRNNFRQADLMGVSVLLSVMRISNDTINTSFPYVVQLICQTISYVLTPLCPDAVECTHLT